jgi:hypothetical protein
VRDAEPGGVTACIAEDVAYDRVVGKCVAQHADDIVGASSTVEQGGDLPGILRGSVPWRRAAAW